MSVCETIIFVIFSLGRILLTLDTTVFSNISQQAVLTGRVALFTNGHQLFPAFKEYIQCICQEEHGTD